MSETETGVDPVKALAGWAAEDAEGRVMTIVEDPSFADWVPMVLARLAAVEAERDECGSALKAVCEMAEELRTALAEQEGAWESEYDGWLVMQRHFRLMPDVDLWDSQELLTAIDGRLLAIGERRASLRAVLSPVADTQQEQPH